MQVIVDDLISVATTNAIAAQALATSLRSTGQWREVVAGIDSVVVQFDATKMNSDEAADAIAATIASNASLLTAASKLHEIPVSFGGIEGPDLAVVCEWLRLTERKFVERICAATLPVEMLGFTPGFAYVGDFGAAADVTRLAQPRTRVPSGSIGVAAGRIGIYALAGPAGWPIIGRTSCTLFDASNESPFVLQPGDRVRFVVSP